MKKFFATFALMYLCQTLLVAQVPPPQPLYPNGPVGDNGLDPAAVVINDEIAVGVTCPDYYLFLPDQQKATGQLVIVCPGGGYGCLCYAREGIEVAQWFSQNGIAAMVLRYRMPNRHHEIPLRDVHTAIRLVREHAVEWGVRLDQVGVMGFSAGGHLVATAATQFDAATRPDFAILLYPVITMQNQYKQDDTRENLLGKEPDSTLIHRYSCELQVKADTPPCFIALSDDDEVVPPRNSTLFYDALRDRGISAEMHIYPTGRHGWIGDFVYWDEYHTSLLRWLRQQREKSKP